MKVGVLAHLFGSKPYQVLAQEIAAAGFDHVQLALWKAFSDVDTSEPGRLTSELAQAIGEAFEKEGVRIAILGCYLHMFDRDEARRAVNVARFKELLRHASDFGCGIVAFETGVNPDGDYTETDWAVMRSTLAELAEYAGQHGVKVGLEAADRHLVGTAQQLHQMLEEVPSPHIGVVLDPGNLMTERNFEDQRAVMDEAFRLIGDRVIACHAKDRYWSEDGKLLAAAPGFGRMDYDHYFRHLKLHQRQVPLIMEEASLAQMPVSKSYLEEKLQSAAELT